MATPPEKPPFLNRPININRLSSVKKLISEFIIIMDDNNSGKIPNIIVKIYYDYNLERYEFKPSHWIKTPNNSLPDTPSTQHGYTEDEAFTLAAEILCRDYYNAIDNGRIPDNTWFVINPFFV